MAGRRGRTSKLEDEQRRALVAVIGSGPNAASHGVMRQNGLYLLCLDRRELVLPCRHLRLFSRRIVGWVVNGRLKRNLVM